MKIENGIIEQESSIGLISIDLRSRKSVSYCTKYDGGEISSLYKSVIFRCNVHNNGVTKNGWTHVPFFDEYMAKNLYDFNDVIINPDTCIAWDESGIRVI
jgi:hypothetical protein